MSRERLNLIGRLLRLRRLDEDREAAKLRGHVQAHADAMLHTEQANAMLEALGRRKSHSDTRRGLDLAGYQAALEFEARAIGVAQSAARQQQEAKDALHTAADRHGQAAAATRVSQARRDRLSQQARHDDELKDSDRLADLRLVTTRSGA